MHKLLLQSTMRLTPLLLFSTLSGISNAYGHDEDPSAVASIHRELQETGSPWNAFEQHDTYVHYPDELKDVLDASFQVLMRSPELYVFNKIPEDEATRIWPLIKGMTLRNHLDNKILWSIPNYLIIDGLKYGCRQMVDGVEEHMPVENAVCSDHCTHQGRYCAPYHPAAPPPLLPAGFKGREIVIESLRRVCFDKYYHGSDIKYFEYLEGFDKANCLQQPDITQCALRVMAGVDHADYSNLVDCVDEENWDNDVTNDLLEIQLKDAQKYGATPENLPMLHIGDSLYQGELSTKHIFRAWCETFNSRPMIPVSCHVCASCHDTAECLWNLRCNGGPLNTQVFLDKYSKEYLPETRAPTEAPELEVVEENPASDSATLPPVSSLPMNDADGSDIEEAYEAKEIEDDKKAIKLFGITVLVCGATVAGLVLYRDKRSKRLMKEAYVDSQIHGYSDDEIDFEMSPSRGGAVKRHTGSLPPNSAFLPEMT